MTANGKSRVADPIRRLRCRYCLAISPMFDRLRPRLRCLGNTLALVFPRVVSALLSRIRPLSMFGDQPHSHPRATRHHDRRERLTNWNAEFCAFASIKRRTGLLIAIATGRPAPVPDHARPYVVVRNGQFNEWVAWTGQLGTTPNETFGVASLVTQTTQECSTCLSFSRHPSV